MSVKLYYVYCSSVTVLEIFCKKKLFVFLFIVRTSRLCILHTTKTDANMRSTNYTHYCCLFQWSLLFDRPFGLGRWPQDHGCLYSVTARTCKEFLFIAWADQRLTTYQQVVEIASSPPLVLITEETGAHTETPKFLQSYGPSLILEVVGLGRRSQDHYCLVTAVKTCSEFLVVRRAERPLTRVRRSKDCSTSGSWNSTKSCTIWSS